MSIPGQASDSSFSFIKQRKNNSGSCSAAAGVVGPPSPPHLAFKKQRLVWQKFRWKTCWHSPRINQTAMDIYSIGRCEIPVLIACTLSPFDFPRLLGYRLAGCRLLLLVNCPAETQTMARPRPAPASLCSPARLAQNVIIGGQTGARCSVLGVQCFLVQVGPSNPLSKAGRVTRYRYLSLDWIMIIRKLRF